MQPSSPAPLPNDFAHQTRDAAVAALYLNLKPDVLLALLNKANAEHECDQGRVKTFLFTVLQCGCAEIAGMAVTSDPAEIQRLLRTILHEIALLLLLGDEKPSVPCPHHRAPSAN